MNMCKAYKRVPGTQGRLSVNYYHFILPSLSSLCNVKSSLGANQVNKLLTYTRVLKNTHTLKFP